MTRPDPDPWHDPLSAVRSRLDDLGGYLPVWSARTEPDAHARRCANDAMDAIDSIQAELHRIRARLITETRQADDDTAARADALLARIREGPPGRGEGEGGPAVTSTPGRPPASTPPPPSDKALSTTPAQRRGRQCPR